VLPAACARPFSSQTIDPPVGRVVVICGLRALIATIVGTVLNLLHVFIEDKLGFIGALIGGIADTAWAVLTYFVVPVLVVEKVSSRKAVSRSSTILRQTWGESLTGAGGLGIIQILLLLPAIGVGVGAQHTHGGYAVALGAIAAVYALALTVVFATLGPSSAPGSTAMPPAARRAGAINS
jgi:hypothetical protein